MEYESLLASVRRGETLDLPKFEGLVLQSQGTDYEASVAFAVVWFKLDKALQFEFLVEQKESRFIELQKWEPLNKLLSLKDFVSGHTEWSQQSCRNILLGLPVIIENSLH